MNEQNLLPIREFSYLTGIRKENLRFYDKIGLLSPELRGENGYRYYTKRQLDSAFLISDLRALGIGLQEIKQYARERSPQRMLALFQAQDAHIEMEIEQLRTMQELMRLRIEMAMKAQQYPENTIVLEEREVEALFLCPSLDGTEEDNLVRSYDYAASCGVNINFPVGAIIPQKSLEAGDWSSPLRYYFKDRRHPNFTRPAGTYAVLYNKCTDEISNSTHALFLDFIQKNKVRIVDDAFSEYTLDELAVCEGEEYNVRVEVRVEKAL